MRLIRIITATAFIFCAYTVAAQNKPNGSGLPSGTLTGVVNYPLDFNQSPNTAPTTYNFTRTYTPLAPMTSIPSFDNTKTLPVLVNTTFQDGFGNPIMSISRTNKSQDIVTPYYNRLSKTTVGYLPFLAPFHSKFINAPFTAQKNFYQSRYSAEGQTAYSKTISFSDQGRPTTRTFSPGAAFVGQERGITTTTDYNTGGEVYKITYANGNLCRNGTYPAGTLIVSATIGQEGQGTIIYKDKSNRTLCKKAYAGVGQGNNGWLETYYVYNEMGKLIYVIPPKASIQFAGSSCLVHIEKLCFSYKYNKYGEIIAKGTPGRTNEDIVIYDTRHRPVLTQSPLLAEQNKFAFTIYDDRSRVVMSGILDNAIYGYTPEDWQDHIYSGLPINDPFIGYLHNGFTGTTYPSSIPDCDIQVYNYYDSYASLPSPANAVTFDNSFSNDYLTGNTMIVPQPYYFMFGKLVGSRTKIIDNSISNNFGSSWITSVLFYDEKGRVIQTQTLNPWNTSLWDVSAVQYNFAGQPVLSINTFNTPLSNKASTKVQVWNDYDENTGELLVTKQKIDQETWKVISDLYTDDMGRLVSKRLGSIEYQGYSYNMRGQLTGINANQLGTNPMVHTVTFAERLSYESGFDKRRFDGSISGFEWRTTGSRHSAYGYHYDTLGRMTAADYTDFNAGVYPNWNNSQRDFSVGNITYDANGNMLFMQQHGYDVNMNPALIDDLSYSYDGNQLMSVTDGGVDSPIDDFDNSTGSTSTYIYDADGNLAADALKNLTLAYNHQDLPTEVTHGSDNIQNIYTAGGTLLQKTIHEGTNITTWHYWGPLVFRNDSLLYILHSEGRANFDAGNGVFKYDYFVKDHLGNVRTVVTSDYEPMSHEYLGTHEIASANIENAIFENLGEVRDTKPDGTPNDVECERLNGMEEDRRIGAALLLRVMAGDQIDVSVYGYHGEKEGGEPVSGEDMFSSLLGVLTQGAGGFNGGAENNGADIVNSLFEGDALSIYENIKESSVDPDEPLGFLNYMVFDEEFNLMSNSSGAEQVDADVNSWEQISATANIEANGYVLIYLSGEDATDIFFDNLNILHHNGRLLEEQHYYPHGLLIKHLAGNTGMAKNRYQYQGKEMQPELGMQLYDFHARQYDPQIGRFWGIDPLDQFPSGYTGMGNDPANNIDPSGMWVNVAWASTSWGRHVLRMGQEKIWQEYQTYLSSRIDPESILNFEMKPKNWDQPFDYAAAELEIVGYANKEWAENFREHVTDEQSKQMTEGDDANGLKYINGGRMAWTPDGKILSTPDEIEAYTGNKINEYWDDDQGTIVSSGANEIKESQGNVAQGTHTDNAIIANAENGAHGYGHNAMLVGNDEHGYQFISKEGQDENAGSSSNNRSTGGQALKPIDRYFPTFNNFLNDPISKSYNRFIMIPVSHTTGAAIINDMRREANSYYNLFLNNCGHAVNNSLEQNGFKVGHYITPNSMFNYIKLNTTNIYYER